MLTEKKRKSVSHLLCFTPDMTWLLNHWPVTGYEHTHTLTASGDGRTTGGPRVCVYHQDSVVTLRSPGAQPSPRRHPATYEALVGRRPTAGDPRTLTPACCAGHLTNGAAPSSGPTGDLRSEGMARQGL